MSKSFSALVKSFKQFPGIGAKSAERMVFHLLDMKKDAVKVLVKTIEEFVEKTGYCEVCGLISEQNPCKICSSPLRDSATICVVKSVQDALMVERSHGFFGLYHVLGGIISPLNNVSADDIAIEKLIQRVNTAIGEIIFALEQSVEGDATIKMITRGIEQKLSAHKKDHVIQFTRMATGIPLDTQLEYIDDATLKKSLADRKPL